MSNVIIQKINLYDLELQGNSSSDEEEENVAKNQQKQPSVASYLTKKSPRQQSIENGADRLVECEVEAELDSPSSLEVNRTVKSPEINSSNKKSSPVTQKSGKTTNSTKSQSISSPTSSTGQKSSTNSLSLFQLIQRESNQLKQIIVSALDKPQSNQQPQTTQNLEKDLQASTEVVIKEELIEIDDDPVVQQTWQDLDQHSFIKQENELMVPPDSLDGENIMEDEIEEQDLRNIQSQKDQELSNSHSEVTQNPEEAADNFLENSELLKPNRDPGVLDEKFGFFYKGSDDSHKSIEQFDEDIMTSQDIPVDFDDDMADFEGNPAKRMKIDPKTPLNSNKIYTHTIVKSLPKGITVKRTSGRQVACKSTAGSSASPDKLGTSLDAKSPSTNGKVIAKIGENLTKIGETFVKFGKNIEKSSQGQSSTLVANDQDEFIVTTIKDEPMDDIPMEEEYTEEFLEEPPESLPEKPLTNADLTKTFNKNIGIVNKFGELSNQIVGRIISKRGEHVSQSATKSNENLPKIGVSPKKFGLDPIKVGGNFVKVGQTSKGTPTNTKSSPITSKVIISTKVIKNPVQNSSTTSQRLSMPSTSYFMPKNFLDMDIKEEKLDDDEIGTESSTLDTSTDPSNFLETKIKEEDSDEYFTAAYNQTTVKTTSKPINSTVTSNSETIVSTKVVTLPASNLLKTRKIIVIKKPVTPGSKPMNGHSIQRALKSQMKSSPGGLISSGNGPENTKYIIKTVSMPNRTIKIENNPKSSLQISSVSSAVNQGPSTSFKTITYPKGESTTVTSQPDAIYRCQKCHLLFSSHNEYTEHLKEHRIPQGIVFNEKRVIKLEELQKLNAFQCAQCSAGFPTLEKLSAHENRHKSEFCCKYCGKTFLQLFRFKEHLVQHEKKKEKYLECEQCSQKFLKQAKLDEHMVNVHATAKDPYMCSYCEVRFPTNATLQDHLRTAHTKKTAMKCGLCNYETYVKQNFEKHASMHMRYVEKLNSKQFFKCDMCPQSFREKGVLEMHKQHMHS